MDEEKIKIIIQVNGKKRAILNVKKGEEKDKILKIAKNENIVKKYLDVKGVKKVVFVKDRIMNILTND